MSSSGKEPPFYLGRGLLRCFRAFCGEHSTLGAARPCPGPCHCLSELIDMEFLYLSTCLAGLSLPKSDLSKIVFDKNIHCFDCTVQVQTL